MELDYRAMGFGGAYRFWYGTVGSVAAWVFHDIDHKMDVPRAHIMHPVESRVYSALTRTVDSPAEDFLDMSHWGWDGS